MHSTFKGLNLQYTVEEEDEDDKIKEDEDDKIKKDEDDKVT